jgi:hypothetical protein
MQSFFLKHPHIQHDEPLSEIADLLLKERCKRRAKSETKSLREIFDEEKRSSTSTAVFADVERCLHYARSSQLPPLPQSAAGVAAAVRRTRFENMDGKPYYRGQVTSGDAYALLFCSQDQLDLLSHSNTFCMDGTFKVVPRLFYQLLVVSIVLGGYTFPVLFTLMTRKTEDLYLQMFLLFRTIAPNFHPHNMMADFEDAHSAALRHAFPDEEVIITGCWFHFCQSVLRAAKRFGFALEYQNVPTVRSAIHLLFALPLLPPEHITSGMALILDNVKDHTEALRVTQRMCDYVRVHYVDKASVGTARMSVYGKPERTNNGSESFNSKLIRLFKTAHPNIYVFLEKLQNVTTSETSTARAFLNGRKIRRSKCREYAANDAAIKRCVQRLQTGQYDVLQFLRAASHRFSDQRSIIPNLDDDDHDANHGGRVQNSLAFSVIVAADNSTGDLHENELNNCEICTLRGRSKRALVPCGHSRFCDDCIGRFQEVDNRCPICRSPVERVLQLY